MYETFYHLSANPFRLTPDPDFCFAHASHKQARAYLEYALKLGEGFIMVTGRPGTGKTTLIESFVNGVDMNEVVATRIAASNLEATDLLRAVAYATGIEAEDLDKATLRLRIQEYFTRQQQEGKRALLIIDEAQGLAHAALEELRLLADLQTRGRPLLQLFLVGQDSLRGLMSSPHMEQFQQRVIGTCFLEPLNLTDTRGYVEHRLRQAGWQGDPEISGAAVVEIYRHSRGVPRHINKTCTRLLLHGFMETRHKLDEKDVLSIAADLREEQLGPLESNHADCTDVVKPMPVPELEDGSLSMAGLALRVDEEELERSTATACAVPQDPRRRVVRHPHFATQPQRTNVRTRKQEGWWPNAVARGHAFRHDGFEVARKLAGRLQSPDGRTVRLGALLVVTLSLAAVLTRHPENAVSEHNVVLAMHPGQTKILSGRPRGTETASAVNHLPDDQNKDWQDVESSRYVAMEVQPEQTPVFRAGKAIPADALIPQAAPGIAVIDSPDSDPVPPEPAYQPLALVSSIEDASDSQVPVSSPQVAVPDEDKVILPVAMELAALTKVEPAPVDADVVSPSVDLTQQTGELISLARRAFKENRLLIPADNNAYNYYQEVLTLQPGNTDARNGIEKIVQRYIQFARSALDRGENRKARQYIQRGLRIQRDNRQLLALQDRMRTRVVIREDRPEAKPGTKQIVNSPPPVVNDVQPPEPENFLSRLKAFFGKLEQGNKGSPLREE